MNGGLTLNKYRGPQGKGKQPRESMEKCVEMQKNWEKG